MDKLNFALAYVVSTLVAPKREEKGATAVEYALVIGLVSIVIVGAVALFKPAIEAFVAEVDFMA